MVKSDVDEAVDTRIRKAMMDIACWIKDEISVAQDEKSLMKLVKAFDKVKRMQINKEIEEINNFYNCKEQQVLSTEDIGVLMEPETLRTYETLMVASERLEVMIHLLSENKLVQAAHLLATIEHVIKQEMELLEDEAEKRHEEE